MENSGGWKTYRKFGEKPLPKNVFGPPSYDTFRPPLFWRRSVISLKRKRRRPDQPQFLRPPKVVLESTLCSTFPPPHIHAIRFPPPPPQPLPKYMKNLLMGLLRGAVFRHGGGALKQPIKQPTETPTSTLALMGRFPSFMGPFPTLMGRFTDFVLRGRFTS